MRLLSELGAAVIGTGFIGTVHVEALRRLGVQVRGVLGSTPDRGAVGAERLGVPRAYGSLEELLFDEDVDVVHVASPNHLHHPQVKQILAAGRHVVCEKPLANTSAQSAELNALAGESGLVNAVNFNIRFYPLNQHVSGMVRDRALGDLRLMSGHYFQDWLLLETDWNWRLEPRLGGPLRAVGDIGSHWLDLVAFLTGLRITEVMADLATFIPKRQQPSSSAETFSTERPAGAAEREIATEDMATILLRFENGARGTVAISQLSAGRKNSLEYELDGSSSSVAWDSEHPEQLWIGHREAPNEILLRSPSLMNAAGRSAAALPGGHVEGFADTFRAMFAAIYAEVGRGEPAERAGYPTFADGHDAMLVAEAVEASARDGRWTAVKRDS